MNIRKNCIFCGENVVSKTMEHVIPQWLIKHTGNPNRTISLGINWNTGEQRCYSFNALRFPACDSCNNEFSKIEPPAKEAMINILNEDTISSESFSILLSWFDKIRIGLWLGFLLLNQNRFGIIPNFYIQNRIDVADRMLLIYRTSDKPEGINFVGVDSPFYDLFPICFGLRIKQFCFINLSTDFLFSRRLGLPYPTEKRLVREQGRTRFSMVEGVKYIRYPLIRKNYDITCTEIYQPIIRPEFIYHDLYSNDYVKDYFDIPSSPLGKILIGRNNRVVDYSSVSGKQWLPENMHEKNLLIKLVIGEVLSFQEWLLDDMPSFDDLDLTDRRRIKDYKRAIKKYNKFMLERMKKEF